MKSTVMTVWMTHGNMDHHLYDFVKKGHMSRAVYDFLQDKRPSLHVNNRILSNMMVWDLIEVMATLSESDKTYLSIALPDCYTPLLP